jgi:hypothetical protein
MTEFDEKFLMDKNNIDYIDGITSCHLVGYFFDMEEGMWNQGNCFSVINSKTKEQFKIVNFGYENLTMLLDMKIVEYPIRIFKLNDRVAIILDERIPLRFYWEKYCTSCCPHDLLPLPQRVEHDLKIRLGDIKHTNTTTSVSFGKDEYDNCGIERLISGTWEELKENHRLRKQAALKPFIEYYKTKYQ